MLPIGATAAAWLTLILLTPVAAWYDLTGKSITTGPHGSHGLFTPAGWMMTATMSIAMMAPLAVPGVQLVAATNPSRAHQATFWFFGIYTTTWVVITSCLQPFAGMLAGVAGSAAMAAGILAMVCALAQLHPHRSHLSATCDSPAPLRTLGSGANTDSARFGLLCAVKGSRLCALPMLTMLAVPINLPVMAMLTTLTVADRVTQGRRRILIAGLYAGLGALLLI